MPPLALSPLLLSLPVLSGLCFAAIGVAYRRADERGVTPLHLMLHMGVWGGVVYAAGSSPAQWQEAPALVIALGLGGGFAQWLTAKLIGVALRLGPLSPMWCALNLTFVPVAIYSAAVFGEPLPLGKGLGVTLAIASVVLGSMEPRAASRRDAPGSMGQYTLVLMGLLLLNSVMHLAIKHLGSVAHHTDETLMEAFGAVFLACLYAAIAAPITAEFLLRRDAGALSRPGWLWGSVAAAGSIGGVGLLGSGAALPGAVVFTLSAIVSLLGAGVASVAIFGERAGALWAAMMGCAVASVILMSA